MAHDFTLIYKKYAGKWIALDKKLLKVISSSNNAKVVYEKAIKLGCDNPTLFKVPEKNIPYFGMNV